MASLKLQNMRVCKLKNINSNEKLKKFISNLKFSYNIEDLQLTHPSQIFITKFYLVTAPIRKISLQIFDNGTILIQSSPKIPKKKFDLEINQIIKMAEEL